MKSFILMFSLFTISMIMLGCGPSEGEKQLQTFISQHLEIIQPLEKEINLSYWQAATTGADDAYKRYSDLLLKYNQIYSNKEDFVFLKDVKESGKVNDPLLKRQLNVLYNGYIENQIDSTLMKEMIDLETKIDQTFSSFRGTIKGKQVSNNEINSILKSETRSQKRKQAWQASKQVGDAIVDDLLKLAKLRNKAAQSLGYENFHTMKLSLREQDVNTISQIFDELYGLTFEPFNEMKSDIDATLANMYDVDANDLKPWHYHDPFFQETPLILEVDLDGYYKNQDIKELASSYYMGIGMPVAPILKKSDLYEREGKNPHAFCTDIDRSGDVRILCNLKDTERWMETMLHELGHGVYDYYMDESLPFLLRSPAHSFTTEAVAMFFGRLSRNAYWMQSMLDLTDKQVAEIKSVTEEYARMKQLIFARWDMVMFQFEKAFYANPDADLNTLWWDLVEKYQGVKRPENRNKPDWAAKIHVALYPCYYHNYLLGELLASQFNHTLVSKILKAEDQSQVSYIGNPDIGDFFTKNVFEPANRYHWNTMIEKATGEPLNPKFFVDQFVK